MAVGTLSSLLWILQPHVTSAGSRFSLIIIRFLWFCSVQRVHVAVLARQLQNSYEKYCIPSRCSQLSTYESLPGVSAPGIACSVVKSGCCGCFEVCQADEGALPCPELAHDHILRKSDTRKHVLMLSFEGQEETCRSSEKGYAWTVSLLPRAP